MKHDQRRVALSAVCVFFLWSCTDPAPSGPPTLQVGVDVCADCGMSIIETKYAAAALHIVDGRREHAVFDDVGCMVFWQEQQDAANILERWSGQSDRDGWIRVEDGHFVVGSSVQTPMDFHIVCCSTQAEAARLIERAGGTLTPFASVKPMTAASMPK